MAGGLMQLVAYGAQDVYLTGNPQITFFKIVYKRHTNFASEATEESFSGNKGFNQRMTCQITKNGDLVTKLYLKIEISGSSITNGKWAWVGMLGYSIIESINMQIGGSIIDRQYGEWLCIWHQLTNDISHKRGIDKMIGNIPELTTLSSDEKNVTLYIPLQFFCCRYNGLAIPLVALQYHEVRFEVLLKSIDKLLIKQGDSNIASEDVNPVITLNDISLLTNYIYLDSEERKRFSSSSHEYLIEQIQVNGDEIIDTSNKKLKLNFNHPCKSLYWIAKHGKYISGKKFLAYSINDTDTNNLIDKASIRYVLGNTTSTGGVIDLNSDRLISYNDITIKGDNEKVTDNQINASVDNFIVINPMSIDELSKSIDSLTFGTRTTDTLNEGHSNFDIFVYMWNNFSLNLDNTINPITDAQLQLNGHDRFSAQDGDYFNYVQPYETHKNTPSDGINVYSFALNPTEHQPSGTCNFSRIDNSTLNLNLNTNLLNNNSSNVNVYTINYNILRIMSGMGGLAYAN